MSGADRGLRLVASGEELELTPGAAAVLLRILFKAARVKQSQAAKEQQR
ncbi:hypothetical protein GCM10009733_082740 [Nonomuraea maheshkhaliensis]|uniref:Uncharacterized protein n=1 Tax=Nonomuraea maheshkhaliensis TaxID=419590 RepID=A0ABN2GLH9_9ACTN